MKPLEAWHIISANMQQLYKRRRAEQSNWKGYTEDELTAEVMCFEALQKQVPKKPLLDNRYVGIGRCPNCNAVFMDNSTNYCGNCGQRLSWSEVNDDD